MDKFQEKLGNIKICIITHTFATGPGQELETYLRGKVKELIFIGHPLPFCKDLKSVFKKYNRQGDLISEKNGFDCRLPDFFLYLENVFYTFYWLLFTPKADLTVSINGLNAFCGIILKKLGKTKKVVFYTIDFVPHRFPNCILNKIYHLIDNYSVRHCDLVWNLSPVMVLEREKKGVEKIYREKQITVPIGTDLNVERLPFEKINRYEIAFMGHLREGQGVEFLIDLLPEIIKKIPQVKLVLIGTGPLEEKLKSQVKKAGIESRVEFTGFIKDNREMQNRLAKCAIAVAPYVDDAKNFTRYTDPGKPKAYLASGLPVIITDIVQVAKEIQKTKCGYAVNFEKDEFVKSIVMLLENKEKLKLYRENAVEFAKKYEWNKVFKKALTEIV